MADRLRDVAERVAGPRIDLLGEQADVVRRRGGTLEDGLGALDAAGARVALREPERGEQERAVLGPAPAPQQPADAR